jgi:putative permease
MKRLAGYTAVAIATLAAVFLLWEFKEAVILFILSLALASVMRPLVDSLAAHALPRILALIITYLVLVLIIITLLFAVTGPVLDELQKLALDIPAAYRLTQGHWLNGSWLQHTIASNFPPSETLFHSFPGGQWTDFFQSFLNLTRSSVKLLSDIFIVFVLALYWSADEEHFKRLWLSLLPSTARARWRDVWQNIDREIGAYLRSELVQSLLTFFLLWSGYSLMGIRYPLLLAIFAAFSWLIVWFGGLAAVVLGIFAGFLISPLMAVAVGLFTLVVLAFLEFGVQPRLFNRTWISSLLIIISVLILVRQFGLLGFLIAPPIAGVIQIFASHLILPSAVSTITLSAPPTLQIDSLYQRLDKVQADLSTQPASASPEITNMVERLQTLLDQAKQEDPFIE